MASVPQIEGLTIEDFLDFARDRPALVKYLPDENDWHHVDKKWLCDVLFTMATNDFQAMVKEAIANRRTKLEQSRNELIEMRPEFAQALKRCVSFGSKS